jgi:integrase
MKKITPNRTHRGTIEIRFTVNGDRKCFAPVIGGRFDNPKDIIQARKVCYDIALDIETGKFDATLEAYKPKPKAELLRLEEIKRADLLEIWQSYVESRKQQVAETTFKNGYPKYTKVLQLCPYKTIADGSLIKRWIIKNKPAYFAKKILQQLNACCKWAERHDLISENPFKDYAHDINKKITSAKDDINPFAPEERDAIIELFKSDSKLVYWSGLVQFMFANGCRPSEALALTWGDCTNGEINFNKAYVNGILKNGLKTQEQRKINQTEKTKEILIHQKNLCDRSKSNKHNLLFIGERSGSYLNFENFTRTVWPKALKLLPDIKHRPPYQMRHTFITLALKAGVSPQDVAKHVGNSPDIIYKNYAGVTRNFQMPDV